ncbi:MAG: dihydrofolate reductase [Crocinitomicaceae bacterium]|jgi:dihydrofolate reductase
MFNWIKKIFKSRQEITMIAAIQNDRGIGYQGELIHSIKNDMKHFVTKTNSHTVIMGRKNWESIPEKYRPMKNRQNIIITRDTSYHAAGATIVNSIEKAIKKSTEKKIYIIGGGQIYTLGMKYANTLDLTLINTHKSADVFFPKFDHFFNMHEESESIHDEKTNLNYKFQIWKRK